MYWFGYLGQGAPDVLRDEAEPESEIPEVVPTNVPETIYTPSTDMSADRLAKAGVRSRSPDADANSQLWLRPRVVALADSVPVDDFIEQRDVADGCAEELLHLAAHWQAMDQFQEDWAGAEAGLASVDPFPPVTPMSLIDALGRGHSLGMQDGRAQTLHDLRMTIAPL